MQLNKYCLGDLITQRREKNPGGNLPILGVSKDGLRPPKQIDADTSIYNLYYRNDFVYNPARMELGSIAFNNKYDRAICSSLYEVFYVHRTDLLLPEYLALFVKHPEFARYCNYLGNGSAREYCRFDNISGISITLPSLSDQHKIVRDYQAITNRIELLTKIHANVQKQMNEIYNDWFVSFSHFPNAVMQNTKIGNIPQGWTVKKLTDLMTYAGGQQPPASEFIFKPKEGYIRLVQIRDYETDNYATYIPISTKNKLCDEEDIMIARYGASLGKICFGLRGAYNVALAKVFPNKKYYREFLRCFLNSDFFYNGINGSGERSAQQGFNQSGMDAFLLPIPPEDVLENFEEIAAPMFKYILVLQKTIKVLSDLRVTIFSLVEASYT